MPLNSLREVLIHELRDMYSAEQQLSKAMPRLARAVSNSELREAIENHEAETKIQIGRLNRMFELLGESSAGEHCNAMEGLIQEAEDLISENGAADAKDAALIAAAQRIEHYEMAGYGSAKAYAGELGLDDVEDLIDETLDEEGNANKKLNSLATGGIFSSGINEEALAV